MSVQSKMLSIRPKGVCFVHAETKHKAAPITDDIRHDIVNAQSGGKRKNNQKGKDGVYYAHAAKNDQLP